MTERMISYAQNAEDVVLARALGERADGFYVDVGANDPTQDSVTRHFYDRGWRGVNIEPQTTCFSSLQAARARDINLNIGVGSSAGRLTFYFVPDAQAMSTFSSEHADLVRSLGYHTEKRDVEVRTLDEVFAEHVGERTVDFLKVDVEGLEEDVLGKFDWATWRPRIVVVESYPEVSPWEEQLVAGGYVRTLWDGINLFFVRQEDAAELGPALRRPATIVLDRYDPWLYAEQVAQAGDRMAAAVGEYLVLVLLDRGAHSESEVRPAAAALAHVLSRRSDVVEHFGVPSETDVSGLLTWASRASERTGEPHVESLLPYESLYRRLSAGRPAPGRPSRTVDPAASVSTWLRLAKAALIRHARALRRRA